MSFPFQQGHLDGLCGAYSCVNAVRYLDENFTQKDGLGLMKHLSNQHSDIMLNALHSGMTFKPLWKIAKATAEYAGLKVSQPYARREFSSSAAFACDLQERLEEGKTIAIIGLSWPLYHWTLARKITRKSIMLFDSSGASAKRHSGLALDLEDEGTLLQHHQTVLFSRS